MKTICYPQSELNESACSMLIQKIAKADRDGLFTEGGDQCSEYKQLFKEIKEMDRKIFDLHYIEKYEQSVKDDELAYARSVRKDAVRCIEGL